MFAFIILACHFSVSTQKLTCEWEVQKLFSTEQACDVYENDYVYRRGEQMGICDDVEPKTREGDKRPIFSIKS